MSSKIHVGERVKVVRLADVLSCYRPLLNRVGTVVAVKSGASLVGYDVEFSGVRHPDGTHIFRFFPSELQHTITQEIINDLHEV